MRAVPRFWTTQRGQADDPAGRSFDLQVWGWSTRSVQEAAQVAADRLQQALARVRSGQELRQQYYPRLPLREETLAEVSGPDGQLIAVITRNRYGAEVLNTEAVLIADVDLPAPSSSGTAGGRGLMGRLFGRPAAPAEPEPDPEGEALQRIGAFAGRHPEWGTHVYRTAAGLRVIVTGTGAAPDSERAGQLLGELDSDPIYLRLCVAHHTYRARLTPKPWRVGDRAMPHSWPLDPGYQTEAVARWLSRYTQRSAGYATCQRIGSYGAAPSAIEQQVLAVHDRVSRADEGHDLPLA